DDFADERRGRVVAAAGAPLVRIHHAFEDTAEHVGRHQLAAVGLTDREVEALEEIVEGRAPIGIAPERWSVAALERRWLEQSAIQKRQAAQGAGAAATQVRGPVQRAEAECMQKRAMEVT